MVPLLSTTSSTSTSIGSTSSTTSSTSTGIGSTSSTTSSTSTGIGSTSSSDLLTEIINNPKGLVVKIKRSVSLSGLDSLDLSSDVREDLRSKVIHTYAAAIPSYSKEHGILGSKSLPDHLSIYVYTHPEWHFSNVLKKDVPTDSIANCDFRTVKAAKNTDYEDIAGIPACDQRISPIPFRVDFDAVKNGSLKLTKMNTPISLSDHYLREAGVETSLVYEKQATVQSKQNDLWFSSDKKYNKGSKITTSVVRSNSEVLIKKPELKKSIGDADSVD